MPFRIPARMSFWVTIIAYLGVTIAAGAPSPLYPVYESRFGFTAITLTAIFGIYALALLVTLLTVGGLSDTVGRKPVLLLAFASMVAAMIVFSFAQGVAWLYVARILQGLAAGASLGALSAAMIDYAGPERIRFASLANGAVPGLGMAIGSIGTGALVQFAPAPRVLVFVVLGVLFVLVGLAMAAGPESEPRKPGVLKAMAPRMRVAPEHRPEFLRTLPALTVTWAQLGFTLSLTTSLAAVKFGITNHFQAGLMVGIVCAATFVATIALRNATGRFSTVTGGLVLLAGTGFTLWSLADGSTAVFVVGGVLTGLGVGSMLGGAIRTLSPLPAPSERGEFFASVYIVGYLAFSLPAVIAGVFIVHVGLIPTSRIYAIAVAVVTVAAIIGAWRPSGVTELVPAQAQGQAEVRSPDRAPALEEVTF